MKRVIVYFLVFVLLREVKKLNNRCKSKSKISKLCNPSNFLGTLMIIVMLF